MVDGSSEYLADPGFVTIMFGLVAELGGTISHVIPSSNTAIRDPKFFDPYGGKGTIFRCTTSLGDLETTLCRDIGPWCLACEAWEGWSVWGGYARRFTPTEKH